MIAYAERLLAVIAAPTCAAKAAMLASLAAPEDGATWAMPELPDQPGRQAGLAEASEPQRRRRSLADTLNWDEPMDLFPWLMIGLLFLLALENLLANRFYRDKPAES